MKSKDEIVACYDDAVAVLKAMEGYFGDPMTAEEGFAYVAKKSQALALEWVLGIKEGAES